MKTDAADVSFLDIEYIWNVFTSLYGPDRKTVEFQIARYLHIQEGFSQRFPTGKVLWFSSPGRTEISGNHTDHNCGRVLAASIDLDAVAAVVKTNDNRITVFSEGFPTIVSVDVNDVAVRPVENGTTAALLRGIVSRFKELGHRVGGFNCCMSSSVMVGSGLSSSASVEMLFGSILNTLYNEGQISPLSLAMIGQYAENVYFGKPSGCMDQLACAIGGIIAIDFKETGNPLVTKVSFDLRGQKYKLMVVDTNGSHENLTSEYAAVPAEMKSVAGYFGKATCREISVDDVIRGAKDMRHILGDRAILRSMHFLEENERVDRQIDALQKNDFPAFLKLVNESGNSSFKWLQNCFAAAKSFEQAIPIALVFTQRYIDAAGEGACRVHGGGFAGTIQVYLPEDHVKGYRKLMSTIFDDNCVKELMIRPFGHVCLNDMVTKENTVKENTCSTLRSR